MVSWPSSSEYGISSENGNLMGISGMTTTTDTASSPAAVTAAQSREVNVRNTWNLFVKRETELILNLGYMMQHYKCFKRLLWIIRGYSLGMRMVYNDIFSLIKVSRDLLSKCNMNRFLTQRSTCRKFWAAGPLSLFPLENNTKYKTL